MKSVPFIGTGVIPACAGRGRVKSDFLSILIRHCETAASSVAFPSADNHIVSGTGEGPMHDDVREACRALAAALVTAVALSVPPASGASLRLMAMNIAEDTGAPSASNGNAWNYTAGQPRRARAAQVVADTAPDIFGIEEARSNQVTDLSGTNLLSAYACYAVGGTDGNHAGLHECLFYRTNRFTRVEKGVFWLSLTPDTPGSTYTGTTTPRIAVWARLLDRASGHTYFALCTHWDPQSSAEREYAAALIRTSIAALAPAVPVVLLGDLNCNETSRAYKILAGSEDPGGRQFTDTYRAYVPVQQTNELTLHNFTGGTTGSRVDFVFVSGDFAVSQAAINRTAYGGRYPSDHYPVDATSTVAAVRPVIVSARVQGDACRLSWTTASGLVYRVESTASLQPWTNLAAEAVTLIATGSLSAAELPMSAGRTSRFYRVVFVLSE